MKAQKYVYRIQPVEAMYLTEDNIDEVASWAGLDRKVLDNEDVLIVREGYMGAGALAAWPGKDVVIMSKTRAKFGHQPLIMSVRAFERSYSPVTDVS